MHKKEIINSEKGKPSFEKIWGSVEVELSPIIFKLFLEGGDNEECAEAIVNAYETASKKFESPQISFIGPDGRFQKSVDIAATHLSTTHLYSHFVRFLRQLKISDEVIGKIYLARKMRNSFIGYNESDPNDEKKETGVKKIRKYLLPVLFEEITPLPIDITNTFIKLLKSFNRGTGLEIVGSKDSPDELSDLSIGGLDFEGCTISDKTITSVNFNNSKLQKLSLNKCITQNISFWKSNLTASSLSHSEFNEPKFVATNLSGSHINRCEFNTPNFLDANLSDVIVVDSEFKNLNLKVNDIKVEKNRPVTFEHSKFTGGSLMSKVFEREPDYVNSPLKSSNSTNMSNQDLSLTSKSTEWAVFDNCEFTNVNFGTDDSRFKFNGCTFTICKKNGKDFDPNQISS